MARNTINDPFPGEDEQTASVLRELEPDPQEVMDMYMLRRAHVVRGVGAPSLGGVFAHGYFEPGSETDRGVAVPASRLIGGKVLRLQGPGTLAG